MEFDEPLEEPEDLDLTLRHVTRLFPDELARALLPQGIEVTGASCLETQLTLRQRRLDRALDVQTDTGRRLLHNEWELFMRPNVPFRLFEYHTCLALAVAGEAAPGAAPPPIESPRSIGGPRSALADRRGVPHIAT